MLSRKLHIGMGGSLCRRAEGERTDRAMASKPKPLHLALHEHSRISTPSCPDFSAYVPSCATSTQCEHGPDARVPPARQNIPSPGGGGRLFRSPFHLGLELCNHYVFTLHPPAGLHPGTTLHPLAEILRRRFSKLPDGCLHPVNTNTGNLILGTSPPFHSRPSWGPAALPCPCHSSPV